MELHIGVRTDPEIQSGPDVRVQAVVNANGIDEWVVVTPVTLKTRPNVANELRQELQIHSLDSMHTQRKSRRGGEPRFVHVQQDGHVAVRKMTTVTTKTTDAGVGVVDQQADDVGDVDPPVNEVSVESLCGRHVGVAEQIVKKCTTVGA